MATATQVAESSLWLDQYVAGAERLTGGTIAAVVASYSEIEDWYDSAQTIAATLVAMQASQAGREAVSGLAGEFIQTLYGILADQVVNAPTPTIGYPRNAKPFDVYSRPVWAYRNTIAVGGSESDALIAARLRAELITGTDVLLAERDAAFEASIAQERANHSGSAAKARTALKYRRVIRPELSETGTCGLCIAASTQIYTVKDLMPIHERCNCKVMPIIQGDDIGLQINKGDLKQFYADAGGNTAEKLKRTRYQVDEHGELGPVLAPKATSSGSAATALDDRDRASSELTKLLPVLSDLERRDRAGEDVSGPLAYQRDRISKLRRVVSDAA